MEEAKGRPDTADQRVAVEVAIRTGLLKRCPVHGEVYDPGQHDYQGANMVVAYLINRSDPLVALFQDDRPRLMELLKSVCRPYPTACGQCAVPPSNHGA